MTNNRFLLNHQGTRREVELEGQTFLHLHCRLCGRDFAKPPDSSEWKAVHLGIFQFHPLDELTNKRWISEECPRQPVVAETNDLRHKVTAFPELWHPAVSRKKG